MRKIPAYFFSSFFLFSLAVLSVGCKKEYSYEGSPLQGVPAYPDSVGTPDPSPAQPVQFPVCAACSNFDVSAEFSWSFKVDDTVLCGQVTRGVISPDGEGMTFFGPSSCSLDSGLIITATFATPVFKTDQTQLAAETVTLQYYDKTDTVNALQSKQPHVLTLRLDRYSKLSGECSGIFGGGVVDKAGNVVVVEAGTFNVRF